MVSVLAVTMEVGVRAVGECTQIRCGVVVARLHALVTMVSHTALWTGISSVTLSGAAHVKSMWRCGVSNAILLKICRRSSAPREDVLKKMTCCVDSCSGALVVCAACLKVGDLTRLPCSEHRTEQACPCMSNGCYNFSSEDPKYARRCASCFVKERPHIRECSWSRGADFLRRAPRRARHHLGGTRIPKPLRANG